jgi:hypothetical protein
MCPQGAGRRRYEPIRTGPCGEGAGKGRGAAARFELEKEAITRFEDFYRVFSTEAIRKGLRELYSEGAYFRDGLKEVVGSEAMEACFLKSAGGSMPARSTSARWPSMRATAISVGSCTFR